MIATEFEVIRTSCEQHSLDVSVAGCDLRHLLKISRRLTGQGCHKSVHGTIFNQTDQFVDAPIREVVFF
jgi:hypothetical protein